MAKAGFQLFVKNNRLLVSLMYYTHNTAIIYHFRC